MFQEVKELSRRRSDGVYLALLQRRRVPPSDILKSGRVRSLVDFRSVCIKAILDGLNHEYSLARA
jgi:hypothetical protein